MRRTILVIALAAALVVAGCSGADTGTETPEETTQPSSAATETPDPASNDSDSSPSDESDADSEVSSPTDLDGISEDGVNGTELVLSHYRTLSNESSYATSQRFVFSETSSDNESVTERQMRLSMEQQRALNIIERQATTAGTSRQETTTQYRAVEDGSETVYTRTNVSGEVRYRTDDNPYRNFSTFYGQSTVTDRTLLALEFELSYDGTVERDGRTLYRVTGDNFQPDSSLVGNASNESATILVDDRGVLRSVEYTFDSSQNGTPIRMTYTYSATGVGETTVEEPDWLDEARS